MCGPEIKKNKSNLQSWLNIVSLAIIKAPIDANQTTLNLIINSIQTILFKVQRVALKILTAKRY